MKLLTLALHNFQAFMEFTVSPNGEDLDIYGQNGLGKTTIFSAITWLWFGKDSLGRSDFDLKTRDEWGKVIPNLDHSVEGVFEIDGKQITFKRVYKEEWESVRGAPADTLTGHTTDFYVNGVPTNKTEYMRQVNAMCPEKTFQMLTDPAHFLSRTNWQDRRRMLVEMCGDVSDAAVIESNQELAPLPEIIGQHSIDDYRKILKGKRETIASQRRDIPARIDEATRSIVEVNGDPIADAKRLGEDVDALLHTKAQATTSGLVVDLENQIKRIDGELTDIVNRLKSAGNPARDAALKEKRRISEAIDAKLLQLSPLKIKIQGAEEYVAAKTARVEELRSEYLKEAAKTYQGETTCPSCGQDIHAEKLDAAVAAFNQARADRLAGIMKEGEPLQPGIDAANSNLEKHRASLAEIETAKGALEAELAALVVPEDVPVDPNQDATYKAKRDHRVEIEVKFAEARGGSLASLGDVDVSITETRHKLTMANLLVASVDRNKKAKTRITELESQQKNLAIEFEKLEGEAYLCEQFIRTAVAMLTDRINSKFKITRFTLFEDLIKDGLKEVCDATYLGQPPSHGQAINMGLDCIDALAMHFGFAPPICIDNAEAVTSILPTYGQQIRLIHSPGDYELRIVTAGTTKEQIPA